MPTTQYTIAPSSTYPDPFWRSSMLRLKHFGDSEEWVLLENPRFQTTGATARVHWVLTPNFTCVITQNCFKLFCSCLHFNNNVLRMERGQLGYDPYGIWLYQQWPRVTLVHKKNGNTMVAAIFREFVVNGQLRCRQIDLTLSPRPLNTSFIPVCSLNDISLVNTKKWPPDCKVCFDLKTQSRLCTEREEADAILLQDIPRPPFTVPHWVYHTTLMYKCWWDVVLEV